MSIARVFLVSVVGVIVGSAAIARADGELTTRGVYYKERSTRVIQPMLDGMFEVGARGLVTGHLLVDAITSASASSGAAAAEPFTERRYEGGLGYAHELDGPEDSYLDLVRIAGEGKVSKEPDYRSVYAGARAEAEIAQKNAVIGVGGGVSLDEINNEGAQSPMGGPRLQCDATDPDPGDSTHCPLTTYSLFTTASQIVSPNALIGVSYDLSWQDGFTSNAYRQVITTSGVVAERHPNQRLRQAAAISGRLYIPRIRTALIASYRYYWDDWDIHAHTPELRIVQEVGTSALASFRYRYYKQDASFFWARRYPDQTMERSPYLTDDPKMSPFDGHAMEAKLDLLGEIFGLEGRWGGARIEGIIEYIVQNNRFGNAVVAHAALTVPFEY